MGDPAAPSLHLGGLRGSGPFPDGPQCARRPGSTHASSRCCFLPPDASGTQGPEVRKAGGGLRVPGVGQGSRETTDEVGACTCVYRRLCPCASIAWLHPSILVVVVDPVPTHSLRLWSRGGLQARVPPSSAPVLALTHPGNTEMVCCPEAHSPVGSGLTGAHGRARTPHHAAHAQTRLSPAGEAAACPAGIGRGRV